MKKSIRNFMVLLVMVASLMAVQTVWADSCNIDVKGDITAVNYDDNSITIDETTTVYGVALNYLANKLKVVLLAGEYVVVTASQCPNTGKLSACTLTVNGGTEINLPGNRYR